MLEGDQLVGTLLPVVFVVAENPKEPSSESVAGGVWKSI